MSYPRAVLTTWLLALLLALMLAYDVAHAGQFYLDGGVGFTHFTCTICQGENDGTWRQAGLPNSMTMYSPAWRVGAGYRFTDAWSLQASYLNAGVAKIRQDYTVIDHEYDPHARRCLAPCTNVGPFHTHDLMEGIELTAAYHWRKWPIQPYIKLGGAAMYHRLVAQFGGVSFPSTAINMHGWIPTAVVGGGVEYGWLYAEINHYKAFSGGTDWSAGLPISKEFTLGTVGIRFPLPFGS